MDRWCSYTRLGQAQAGMPYFSAVQVLFPKTQTVILLCFVDTVFDVSTPCIPVPCQVLKVFIITYIAGLKSLSKAVHICDIITLPS